MKATHVGKLLIKPDIKSFLSFCWTKCVYFIFHKGMCIINLISDEINILNNSVLFDEWTGREKCMLLLSFRAFSFSFIYRYISVVTELFVRIGKSGITAY